MPARSSGHGNAAAIESIKREIADGERLLQDGDEHAFVTWYEDGVMVIVREAFPTDHPIVAKIEQAGTVRPPLHSGEAARSANYFRALTQKILRLLHHAVKELETSK